MSSSQSFNHIERITLSRTLPQVFRGEEDTDIIHGSHVWLENLTFERGGRYLVSAESGTGKSSMCAYIYGSRCDYGGVITFDGRDVRGFTPEDWCRVRRSNIAYLPQDMRLFPELTVMENLQIKNRLTRTYTESQLMGFLDTLGIADKASEPGGHLSIGQMQRVAIIRALCQPMDFLLLDEPVSHLDKRNNKVVADLIDEVARENGAAVIATSVGNHLSIEFDRTILL